MKCYSEPALRFAQKLLAKFRVVISSAFVLCLQKTQDLAAGQRIVVDVSAFFSNALQDGRAAGSRQTGARACERTGMPATCVPGMSGGASWEVGHALFVSVGRTTRPRVTRFSLDRCERGHSGKK